MPKVAEFLKWISKVIWIIWNAIVEERVKRFSKWFEKKISSFFDFIKTDDNGQRLIAKIKDEGSAFSQDEIYLDFTKLYRKYTIKNKDLGDFFIRETKDILNQLCDDFERSLNSL